MAAPVVVRFQVEGVSQVQAAFRTVEQAAIKAEQAKVSGARQSARVQVDETRRSIADQIAANKVLDTFQKTALKEREKEEKAKARAAELSAKEQIEAWKKLDAFTAAARSKGLKDHERAEADKARVAAREAKKRADAEIAAEEAVARRRGEIQRAFARSLGHGLATGAARGIQQSIGISTQMMQGVLGLGGGFSLSQAVTERMAAEKQAMLLSNAAFQEGAEGPKGKRVDSKDILNTARAAAISSGMDVNDLLEASHEYVARGSDLSGLMSSGGKGGKSNMEVFAKIAKVNNADVKDVFTAMGMLRAQNEELGPEQLQEMMLNVAAQGRHGAVELKDLAKSASRLGKNASNFGGNQGDRQRELLALAQLGIKASGSAAETATTISNFATYGARNAGVIGFKTDNSGRIVSDAKGNTDMASLIGHVFEKARGNVTLMGRSVKEGGFGFGIRGNKLFQSLSEDYQTGFTKAKEAGADDNAAVLAGRTAVEKKVRDATQAKGSVENLNAEHSALMSTPAERLDAAFRKLRDSAADKLVPALEEMIPVVEKIIPVFTEVVASAAPAFIDFLKSIADFANQHKEIIAYLARHPIGALIVGNITASLAKAAIGETVRTVLINLLKGAAPGGGVGGAGGGGGLKNVAAGAMVTAALAIGSSSFQALAEGTWRGTDDAGNLAAKVRAGQISAKDAKKAVDEAQGRLDKGNAFGHIGDYIASPLSDKAAQDAMQYNRDKALIDSDDLAKTIKNAMIQGAKEGAAEITKMSDPSHPSRNGPTAPPLNQGVK